MTDWRVYHPEQDAIDDHVTDVWAKDAFNRFAREAEILLDDPNGEALAVYQRGTPIELQVYAAGEWRTRWGGFVVDPKTEEDETQVTLYGHDLWLRKRNVMSNYEEMTIREILKDLIDRLTPLQWDDELVDIEDNRTLSIKFSGQQLDEVISELSTYSGDEDFGATNDRRFWFQRRGTRQSSRDITPDSYTDAEFDEDGTNDANQVTVYYDDGDSSVTVNDRDAQEELAESIGAEDRVILDVTKSYPETESEENARNKAEDILNNRSVMRTGTVTTWDSFDVFPGDEMYVDIPEHDVDKEMAVAAIEYHWTEDETEITLASGDEGVVDALVDLSDEVERIDSRDADEDALRTEIVNQLLDYEVSLNVTAYERTVPENQFLAGDWHGNLGHPDVGGGYLGDMTSEWEEFESVFADEVAVTYTEPSATSSEPATEGEDYLTFGVGEWTHDYSEGVLNDTIDDDPNTLHLGIPTDGANLYWPMLDDPSDNIAAASWELYPHEGVETGLNGPRGAGAWHFPGGDSYATTSGDYLGSSEMDEFSFAIWFKPDHIRDSGYDTLFETADGPGEYVRLEIGSGGSVAFRIRHDWEQADSAFVDAPTEGDWALVVGSYDNGTMELWTDGDSGTTTGAEPPTTYNDVYVGASINEGDNFQGDIGPVVIRENESWTEDDFDAFRGRSTGDARWRTETVEFDSPTQPEVRLASYDLDGGSIQLTITGSPGHFSDEEEVTIDLDGDSTYSPFWSTSHEEFRIEVSPSSLGRLNNPTMDRVYLWDN
ncbi:LamG domain-containing protein [Natrarchaeobaculum sulfurireducens]|uniref:LamG domain-containing protein n=1 Tax=Natrarchaeobaculum sulfurireducens TaxID=2044521 RepID=A0A346PPP3_9EURY|nr:LamG domain-containing protein [Natrarchaeobaculum sulfurireducens]AXR81488.1 hypothetical protein AArcMg_1475 [Natrarchaeobaculum sulfurireducens]